MFRGIRFGLAACAALFAASQVDAFGKKRGAACDTCDAPPACAPAVQWVDQKVTAYRCVPKQREVEVLVNKMVSKEVEFKYTVNEMVTTPEKRTEKYCEMVQSKVPFKYTVNEMVTVPEKRLVTQWECVPKQIVNTVTVMERVTVQEKRKVVECQRVEKEETFKYLENVVTPVKEKRQVTSYTCVPKQVENVVNVCRKVWVAAAPACDTPCGATAGCGEPCAAPIARGCCGKRYSGCGVSAASCGHWETVTEQQKVMCTVMERVATTQEVEVTVHKCSQVEKTGSRKVCTLVPVEKEITVNVIKCVPVQKQVTCTVMERVAKQVEVTVNVCKCVAKEMTGERIVCTPIEKTREVTVNVVRCVPKEMVGKKTVWDCVQVKEKAMQTYYEQEAYETTVKVCVPVACAAPAPCATASCASDCGTPCEAASGCGAHVARRCCGK